MCTPLNSAIDWQGNTLWLLDQRALPVDTRWLECTHVDQVNEAIQTMVVRGAPAIGIAAAYGVVLSAIAHRAASTIDPIIDDCARLAQSRPTAVNLQWAIDRMLGVLKKHSAPQPAIDALVHEAEAIHREDIENNLTLAEHGAAFLAQQEPASFAVMTHCNTGALATGGHGTALGIIQTAWSRGVIDHVVVNETRPWMQGARLTAWELQQSGISMALQTEGAAGLTFSSGKTRWLIVGADRIAANGDVANKIGTYTLAIAARHHGMRVMVAAPISTFDLSIPDGSHIPIETRSEDELFYQGGTRIAPDGIRAFNPAFDITPHTLIDALVTEQGVIETPCREKIENHVKV
ncbi:S-methyl-5-thioribose-1-phosphate isomerase [Larsenimonas suaedae]|uniref:Methylthioribose-1-phosphate isomerase n=1 Tax=Larsenimonas suaedae TaxID=1851019 RepID=A0ABU1GXA3_9GAMM|nr:S-methyl-5-thioribose-1-phosphate isomerase [Larsenimonas suaedae]MCM2971356.1 S-methyl-5-thioribose-1-phosphate isomerase [Larsenimonas suaedae]MDR5896067.1 S-methyl-5-thioribose-1-phosphate isomerase [Larsenimonas suaedae]